MLDLLYPRFMLPGLFLADAGDDDASGGGASSADDDQTDPEPDKGDDDSGDKDWKADADKWKALARKHEKQAKDNADAAKRLTELEDKDKTEQQRLTDKATKAQREAAEARQELARTRVAMRKGLTESQAKRLVGETEEDLEADADELLESFGAKKDDEGDKPSRRPKEKLKGGASSDDDEPSETDPRKLAEMISPSGGN